VRYRRVTAFVEGTIPELLASLNLKQVDSGANVLLLTLYDKVVFYGALEIDGMTIATPVQVFLDLQGFSDRSAEAAQSLLEQVIRPAW